MPTLVERAREIISVENDNYFADDTILFYINRSQKKIVSYAIAQEEQGNISLRALDDLRKIDTSTPTTGNTQIDSSYYEVDVDIPADLNKQLYLSYNDVTTLREIGAKLLFQLNWGNLVPSVEEGYYYSTLVSTTKTFRLFLHEDPDGSTDDVKIYYIANPTEVGASDESFTELPDQLENAVLYGTALLILTQESVAEPNNELSIQTIRAIYQEELSTNLY